MYVCMYVCMRVCVYIHISIHIEIDLPVRPAAPRGVHGPGRSLREYYYHHYCFNHYIISVCYPHCYPLNTIIPFYIIIVSTPKQAAGLHFKANSIRPLS